MFRFSYFITDWHYFKVTANTASSFTKNKLYHFLSLYVIYYVSKIVLFYLYWQYYFSHLIRNREAFYQRLILTPHFRLRHDELSHATIYRIYSPGSADTGISNYFIFAIWCHAIYRWHYPATEMPSNSLRRVLLAGIRYWYTATCQTHTSAQRLSPPPWNSFHIRHASQKVAQLSSPVNSILTVTYSTATLLHSIGLAGWPSATTSRSWSRRRYFQIVSNSTVCYQHYLIYYDDGQYFPAYNIE